MARNQVDTVDLAAMPLFILGSLTELGLLGGLDLPLLGDPGQTIFTIGSSTEISLALVVSLAALAVVVYTNEWSLSAMGGIQAWIVVATIGLIILPPFMPILQDVLSADIGKYAAFMVQTAGYTVLSYMG
jgi:hypothetical protein